MTEVQPKLESKVHTYIKPDPNFGLARAGPVQASKIDGPIQHWYTWPIKASQINCHLSTIAAKICGPDNFSPTPKKHCLLFI